MAKKAQAKKKSSGKKAAAKAAPKKTQKKAAPKKAGGKVKGAAKGSAKASAKGAAAKTARTKKSAAAARKSIPAKAPKPRLPKGPVWQWSALETAAAIRSGAVSALEVTQAHVERRAAVNPKLNAVVFDFSEQAIADAKAADKARTKGAALGALHGVPITIKENVDYEGYPNVNGVKANLGLIAPSDSPVVRNLKKSGAIVLGLTNTPEFSFRGFTDNPLHGLTLNPWDESITCGGSSGGGGAFAHPTHQEPLARQVDWTLPKAPHPLPHTLQDYTAVKVEASAAESAAPSSAMRLFHPPQPHDFQTGEHFYPSRWTSRTCAPAFSTCSASGCSGC